MFRGGFVYYGGGAADAWSGAALTASTSVAARSHPIWIEHGHYYNQNPRYQHKFTPPSGGVTPVTPRNSNLYRGTRFRLVPTLLPFNTGTRIGALCRNGCAQSFLRRAGACSALGSH